MTSDSLRLDFRNDECDSWIGDTAATNVCGLLNAGCQILWPTPLVEDLVDRFHLH